MLAQRGVDALEAVEQFLGHSHLFVLRRAQHVLEVHHEPAQVVQGHHGHAVAHQGVVRVVPLWALGVHPNAALRNEVRHLGEHRRHQLLDEVDFVDEDMGLAKERSVTANFAALQFDLLLGVVVVVDGVFGILKKGVVRLDAVRHVRVDKRVVLEVLLQLFGVVGPEELEELEEVDDLVIAPVTNVGPGVVGLNRFPLKAILEDAVGVVPVEGGGVEELENHALDEFRVGVDQGFPVLEDVAPVFPGNPGFSRPFPRREG